MAVVVRWTSATGFFGRGWWPWWLGRADAAVSSSGVWCVIVSWCAIGWVWQLPMGMRKLFWGGGVEGKSIFSR